MTTVAAAAAAVAVVAGGGRDERSTPTPTLVPAAPTRAATVFAGSAAILPLPPMNRLTPFTGREARSSGVTVESVPADEGFWIGHGTERLWVQLAAPGESAAHVRAGQMVAFRGRIVANPAGFAREIGLTSNEGAEQLERQGVHIVVALASLSVR
jgi:hypothetical protein